MKTKRIFLVSLLMLVSLGLLAACSKMSQEEEYLTSGTWIDEFDWEWVFNEDGTLSVNSITELATGRWTYTEDGSTLARYYNFGGGDIPRHDHIKSINNSTMVLESIDFPGEVETWHKK